MIPDRITLLIACAIAATPIAHLSPAIREALGLLYSVHVIRSHRRDLARFAYARTVSTRDVERRAA